MTPQSGMLVAVSLQNENASESEAQRVYRSFQLRKDSMRSVLVAYTLFSLLLEDLQEADAEDMLVTFRIIHTTHTIKFGKEQKVLGEFSIGTETYSAVLEDMKYGGIQREKKLFEADRAQADSTP